MSGGRLQDLLTRRPVAGTQLVRLQRVEDPKRLSRVTSHIQAVNGDMLDHVVGIDDERRSKRHAFILVEDAERSSELLLVIGDPREVGLSKLFVGAAPREVNVRGVGRGADQDRVAVL